MIRRASILLLLVMLVPGTAQAVWFWGTKPVGMGTAFTAVADDNNALQVNPSGIAMIDAYSLDVEYERREYTILDYPQFHQKDLQPEEEDLNFGAEFFTENDTQIDENEKNISDFWHVSIVDGKTTDAIAVGLSFTGANFPNRTFAEGKDYAASLGVAGGVADIFYIGVAGKYRQLEPGDTNVNMDAGILIRAIDFLGFGVAGRNVFGGQDPYLIEREVAVGLAGFVLNYATVSFDFTKVFDVDSSNTFNFAAGAEGFVYRQRGPRSGLVLRGGFTWEGVYDRDRYAFGLGWVAPEGTLGYSFRGDIENPRNFSHMLNLNMAF